MFKLGAKSKAELVGVTHNLVLVVNDAIKITPVDFSVHDGIRTQEEQKELYNNGASHTLKSLHLIQLDGFGHAVDLVPFINKKLRWEWEPIYKIAHAVAKSAEKRGLELVWGGVWDRKLSQLDTSSPESLKREVELYVKRRKRLGKKAFIDGPHFQTAK